MHTPQHSAPCPKVDPPEATALFRRGSSLCFLNEASWLLSGGQQGRVLHMVQAVAEKVGCGPWRAPAPATD